ncbi:hypothetical protein [Paenibacillus sp. L3-i20]|uniref:hypothetical protein n=1 Tax=Paenibacillus sp. L3-i20 TaxID=2905833 RepID=UPI001EE09E0C|nr:hypothetical protein [Paenibacillus sp. L3-i20]GKU80174.1 hypothetical protein L3i20_v245710 [Paenibacillus sp. L3-i20]
MILTFSIIVILHLIFEIVFTIRKAKKLNKPMQKIHTQTSKYYNDIHKQYLAYKHLTPEEFRIVKLGVRALSQTSPFEKMMDVFTKILFTTGLTLMTLTLATSSTILSLLNNEKFIDDKTKWKENVQEIVTTIGNSSSDGFEKLLTLAAAVTLMTIFHICATQMKNDYISQHLVVIDEVEKERNLETERTQSTI